MIGFSNPQLIKYVYTFTDLGLYPTKLVSGLEEILWIVGVKFASLQNDT
jgi:hypothetical protein